MEDTSQYLQNMENIAASSHVYNNPLSGLVGGHEKYDTLQNINAMQYQSAVNANEAEKLRDWQEKMSNTEIQRRAKDLESVGFSPMALLGNASGASTPSGASGSAGSGSSPSSHGSNPFVDMLKTMGLLVLGGVKLGAAKSLASQKMAQSALIAQGKLDSAASIAELGSKTRLAAARIMKGIIR